MSKLGTRSGPGKVDGKPTEKKRTREQRLGIADPQPQIIAKIRQRGMNGAEWGAAVTLRLLGIWYGRMSAADRRLLVLHEKQWLASISQDAVRELDGIIVRQAATTGWRTGLSELVQWRLSEWEMTTLGLRRLRQYSLAIERAAKIFQRKKKPPLDDPELYPTKVETVKELRQLLTEMRGVYNAQLSKPPGDLERILSSHFVHVAKKRSRSFPYLAANRDSWQAFFEDQPAILQSYLSEKRLRPASLFDLWFGWCKGVDPERLRQVISLLGSSLRKPIRQSKL